MVNYKSLDSWIQTRKLASFCYEITQSFPANEVFGLMGQIRQTVVSIPSNLAQSCTYEDAKDTLGFLFIAQRQLFELEIQFYISHDLKYITNDQLTDLLNKINESKQMIDEFIKHNKSRVSNSK